MNFVLSLLHWGDPRNFTIGAIIYQGLLTLMFALIVLKLAPYWKKLPPTEPPLGETGSPAGPELSDTLDEDYKAVAAYERRRKILKWAIFGSPLWIMGGCVAYNVFDSLRSFRESVQYKDRKSVV